MKKPVTKSSHFCPRHLVAHQNQRRWLPGLFAAASLLSSSASWAANDAWSTAPATANFSGTNWTLNTTVPGAATGIAASGDALFFGASSITSLNNDDTNFSFAGLTFNAGTLSAPTGAFTISGNTFALTGNVTNNSTVLQTIAAPFSMTAARTFVTSAGGEFIRLSGDISGTGGQIVTGTNGSGQTAGALFLGGNNSFTGASFSITGGTITTTAGLLINSSNRLAGGTVVLGSNTAAGTGVIVFNQQGATLAAASGGVTIANGILTNNTDGIFASGGDITVNGLFQFGGSNLITVNNNTTLANIDLRDNTSTGARTGTFNGTGNLTISGNIINGSSGSAGVVAYTGSGTMTLSGAANTFTGGTQAYGGTVTLDYTTNNTTKISGTGTGGSLSLGGGSLNLRGGSTTEVVASTTLAAGASTINQTGGGLSTITLGALTRSAGSTLSLGAGGIARTTTGTANTLLTSTSGVIGVVGGNDWAAKDGTGTAGVFIVGLSTTTTGYTNSTASTVAASANTDVVTNVALGGTAGTTSTLRFNTVGAQTVDATGTTLTLTQGGILVTTAVGSTTTNITGGTLKPGSNNSLVVFQNNTAGGLTIGSTVADGSAASTFIQSGSGTVTLANATNTYTGATYLNGGITNIAADGSFGTAPAAATANSLVLNGGTVQFGANNITLAANRGIALLGNGGTFDTNNVTGSTVNGIIANGTTPAVTTGRFIKTGAGTLTLNPTAGPNTYTGATVVNNGTLSLAKAGTSAAGGTLAATPITVNSGGTLLLSANYAMTTTSPVTLSGGTFSVGGGVTQGAAISAGTTGNSTAGVGLLTLTASSSLSFAGASGTVVFGSFDPTNLATNSYLLNVSGTNFGTSTSSVDGTNDRLVFNQLLSTTQLAAISFSVNGTTYSATEFQLGASNYYEVIPGIATAVPEPSTWVSGFLLIGLGAYSWRGRKTRHNA